MTSQHPEHHYKTRLGIFPDFLCDAVSNTALETTPLVMCDSNTFLYVVAHFLMALRILYITYHKNHKPHE